MKPFDLEAAKAGVPICTLAGRPLTFIIARPPADKEARDVVIVETPGGTLIRYAPEHLCMAPTKVVKYCCKFVYDPDNLSSDLHDTKEQALAAMGKVPAANFALCTVTWEA